MELNYYNIFKFFHIVFITTWMAGLFYIPRLFVYHSKAEIGSKEYKTFITMEQKLMKYIMNPSLIFSWVFGIILTINLEVQNELWLNLKFVAVFFLSAFHMYCARIRKVFESGQNKKSDKYYRWINEVPTILFLVIVFLVVFKPIV